MNKLLISLLVTIGITGVAHAAGDAAAGKGKTAVCAACHGADGNSPAAMFPKIAGQNEAYLIKQMNDIKGGQRPVLEMTGLLDNLSDQDIADIAAYFAKQNGTVGHAAKDLVEQGQKIYRGGIPGK
ncbi:cytochrome c, partial [Pseudoalteromonas sp.]|uniref:c-type cytochrome n=1 Tax=Pseudoalteromonas sp. TaxID=53249 RepID=UPI0026194420